MITKEKAAVRLVHFQRGAIQRRAQAGRTQPMIGKRQSSVRRGTRGRATGMANFVLEGI